MFRATFRDRTGSGTTSRIATSTMIRLQGISYEVDENDRELRLETRAVGIEAEDFVVVCTIVDGMFGKYIGEELRICCRDEARRCVVHAVEHITNHGVAGRPCGKAHCLY